MEVSRHWRLKKQRYAMDGITTSRSAGYPIHHSGLNGHANGSNGTQPAVVTLQVERTDTNTITQQGTVYSYTTVLSAPADFAEQAPYALAMIELDDGTLLTAQLTDLSGPPEIGMRVEMVTRKLRTDGHAGMIVYGYKFRPLLI